MLFVAYGYHVRMYDLLKEQVDVALKAIGEKLKKLEGSGTLRGHGSAYEQFQLVTGTTDLKKCIQDAIHVQVCSRIIDHNFMCAFECD